MSRLCIVMMMGGLLAGCALGPEPQRPDNAAAQAGAFVNAEGPQALADLTHWWQRFDDPVTDQLVAQALERNNDLLAATARVAEARALLGVATGQRLPQISGGFNRLRQRSTFDFGAGRMNSRTTTYSLEGMVSWQVDVFGKLRRQQQQAAAELAATQADHLAVRHTVIAETVRLRATIATLQKLLELARSDIDNWQQTRDIISQRYERGIATALDLRLSNENLAASRAAEPEAEYQLAQARHALDVLVGRQPATGEALARTLSDLPPTEAPPVGVPAALLDRRPDLMSTELRTAAATFGVGAAIADLFPDFTISASAGRQASRLYELDDPQSIVWSLLMDASWRVFAGGALRANVDAAKARAKAAAAQYAQAVLNALKEVEDAMVRERTARQQYEQLKRRVAEAKAAEGLAEDRYQRGVESIITVLDTERRRTGAERELLTTQLTVWEARINLILALGGDWVAEPGTDATKAPPPAAEPATGMTAE